MWKFTNHVLQRMVERDYSQQEVLHILNGEVPVLIYPSPREETVDLYFGQVDNKYIMIPIDRISKSVITIRPMHKNEKEVFLKEIKND